MKAKCHQTGGNVKREYKKMTRLKALEYMGIFLFFFKGKLWVV